jgi:hypothetical protein
MNPQQPPSPGDDANLTVDLTVSLHKVWDEECIIDLEFTNTSRITLELSTHSLPWCGEYSMVLVATDTLPIGNPVPRLPIIDDPWIAFTNIKPGESLQGEIRLADRIPDLVEVLKRRDMILFWAYQPTTVNQIRGKWVGGWLLLPKLT